ncbi:MAG: hypothetical protein A2Y38_04655 [Spirochaetes bacterium GWB1_59_5]|nr:MAG: hypothetical protein A2Y38_04655 [Spirochaetes bacterium GWB1_59_5]
MSDYSIPGPAMRQGEPPGPYDSAISDRLMGLVRMMSRQQQNPGDFPVEDLMATQRMAGFPSPMDAEVSTLGPRALPASGVPSSWPAGMKNKRVGWNAEQGNPDPGPYSWGREKGRMPTRTMRYTPGSLDAYRAQVGGPGGRALVHGAFDRPDFALNYGETVPSFMLDGPPGGTGVMPASMARQAEMDAMRPGSGGEGRLGQVVSGDDALMDAMVSAMRGAGPKTSSMRSGPSEAAMAAIGNRPRPGSPQSDMPDFSTNPASLAEASPAMLMALFGSAPPSEQGTGAARPPLDRGRRPYETPNIMTSTLLSSPSALPASFRRPTRR